MTQTLNVEYQELVARADEIERPLPPIPSIDPKAPCEISFVKDAATQLAFNADAMRLYLKNCEREWKTLAQSLRNAAKAYQEVDEAAADGIANDTSAAGVASASVTSASVTASVKSWALPPPRLSFEYPYYEVRQAAQDIEAGDQGTAFRAFAKEWDTYQRTLQKDTMNRFRPFISWEGEARSAVEANFDQQRQWLISMVALCNELASQANMVVDAHKKATLVTHEHAQDDEHPTTKEISLCDDWYKYYLINKNDSMVRDCILWYEYLQGQSEEALARYMRNAQLPLRPVNPQRVPVTTRIDAPKSDDSNRSGDGNDPFAPPDPFNEGDPPSADPVGDPSIPSAGMPSMPSMPPMPNDPTLTGAAKDVKGSPSPHPMAGLKPASVGGGGVGVPSMPLRPGVGSEGSSSAATPPLGAAAPGRGIPIPPAYAALGGAGGGMPPMAPAGQDQGGKAKRVQCEDESLYTEERQWTEGVIGNRSRKAHPDKVAS
ncbi:putative alanine and glycine rich protein [Mycobacterium numidiamassiliense]|uniref:Putative alanine and glycine rich protein n=1 Tax=Mycobacterium numidiamassiliense TaxID=1841861 RepID=A0A2U3PE41_9MYCO|nr:hypothetical protein [Mycobacterium numidiamassiliense]SPM41945.1 putative alanine and glycine rich protein [Mycobacterium numidiamassiliense]